jgi:tetratricopeptide (TPR) repeat protein
MNREAADSGLELERARALIELHRFDEAASLLQKLVGREPDEASAWSLLAQAQLGAGRPHDALEAASRAAALTPDDDWPHRLRSVALQTLGADESAVAAAREAVRVAPYLWQCHVRLCEAIVLGRGDLDEAQAAAERSLELAPHESDPYYELGLVAAKRGKHDEAERYFRQALAIDPDDAAAHNALARLRFAKSRFNPGGLAGAAAGFRDAVQSNPRAGTSARNLELVLRVFLARLSYLIFIVVWLASRFTGGTVADRVGPLLLFLVPAGFAVRFLMELAPDLRRQVRYMAFHGPLAAPMFAQACAVLLLCVGAAAPSHARPAIAIAAFVVSLAARLLLARRSGWGIFPWSGWFKRRRA